MRADGRGLPLHLQKNLGENGSQEKIARFKTNRNPRAGLWGYSKKSRSNFVRDLIITRKKAEMKGGVAEKVGTCWPEGKEQWETKDLLNRAKTPHREGSPTKHPPKNKIKIEGKDLHKESRRLQEKTLSALCWTV